ncbi:MAG: right-handed parallel beta-helix repeat-containing protein [Planctomycetota bacterium]|jgi:hypothetical protein
MRLTITLLAITMYAVPGSLLAENIFVNNLTGADRNDGGSPEISSGTGGPVRSISRAVRLATSSDVIVLAKTDVPYFDEVTLDGRRASGNAERPFRIEGNGATLSGAMSLPFEAWEEIGRDLWKVTPYRKGHYQLIRGGVAVGELRPAEDDTWTTRPNLDTDQWCAWKGAIYYRSERNADPREQSFGIAHKQCGITLHPVRHVEINDLTIQHYRLDGINVHDRASNVTLRNVTLVENGRSGLTIAGSARVRLEAAESRANRQHSMLIQETAGVDVQDTILDTQPTVR